MKNSIRWNLIRDSHAKRRLTDEQVRIARARVALGETPSAVARDMGVHHSTIAGYVGGIKERGYTR